MKLYVAYGINIACLSTEADMPLCSFFFSAMADKSSDKEDLKK